MPVPEPIHGATGPRPTTSRHPAARPPRRILPGLAGLTLGILVVACGSAAPTLNPTPVPTPSAPPTVEPTARPVVYPLELLDDEGGLVELPAEPERIVSLTPATTEILFALGAGDRVVATTDFDDYPPEAVELPNVATYTSVDVEAILGLEVDLVFAGGNFFTPPDAIERLRSLGIPVLVTYAPTVEAILLDIELIGIAVNRHAAALELRATLAQEFVAVEAATANLPRPRVFYELDATGAIYGPADDSFIAQMITLAGGEPITTGSTVVFEISIERLIQADPEVIVLGDAAYGVTPEQVAARPGWSVMTAVREDAIRPVDDLLVTRPGPRIGDGLRLLAEAIHPGFLFN